MISIKDKTKCCGCTACFSSCPKKCISMEYDEEGFLYPVVDTKICVDCKICEKVCPFNNTSCEEEYNSLYAAVQYKDEEKRKESTAGGAFSLIADKLLDSGAVVYAVGYDSNVVVCHKRVNKKEGLPELRGSKYVQSFLGKTFESVKSDLNSGNTVLFVGTPCQIAGLKNVIGENDRLYTIDLLCLGVSSPKLFEEYIGYLNEKYQNQVNRVLFRNKYYGYATPNVRVCFDNGKYIQQTYDSKVHADLFFNHYNVRPCCYECEFRERPRMSDFTIGDFNDIGEVVPEFDDNKGTTKIWVHSQKGQQLLKRTEMLANIRTLKAGEKNIIGGKKVQIIRPEARSEFFDDVNKLSYVELIKKWHPYNPKGTLVSFMRNMINPFPFRDKIFKMIRLRKIKSFNKNVARLNSDGRSKGEK